MARATCRKCYMHCFLMKPSTAMQPARQNPCRRKVRSQGPAFSCSLPSRLDASQSLALIAGCERLPPHSVHPAVRRMVVPVLLNTISAGSCFHPPLLLTRLDLGLGLGIGLDLQGLLGVRFGLDFRTGLLGCLRTLAGRLLLHLRGLLA